VESTWVREDSADIAVKKILVGAARALLELGVSRAIG
jgi:hypothetical protein